MVLPIMNGDKNVKKTAHVKALQWQYYDALIALGARDRVVTSSELQIYMLKKHMHVVSDRGIRKAIERLSRKLDSCHDLREPEGDERVDSGRGRKGGYRLRWRVTDIR